MKLRINGPVLRRARQSRKWSLREAASYMKISYSHLCHYESGKSQPKLDIVGRLCHLYHLTPNDILTWRN